MPFPVVLGSQLTCSFGVAPSVFSPTPAPQPVMFEGKLAGTVTDFVPMVNIKPFGMCTSPSNPQVIAAQGAPVPCIPLTSAPWIPMAPTKVVYKKPVLLQGSTCNCMWGGVIMCSNPGVTKEQIS